MLIGAAGDQQRRALAGGDLPHPLAEQGDAILGVGDEGEVGQGPEDPARQAGDVPAAQVGDGIPGADHRHAAQIDPAEGRQPLAPQPGEDVAGHPVAGLHGGAGHAGQGGAVWGVAVAAQIPDGADLRVAGDGEIGLHLQPAAAVDGAPAALRQQPPEARGPHASGPADGGGLQAPLPLLAAQPHLPGGDVLHPRPEQQLHPRLVEVSASRGGKRGRHRRQHPIHQVDEDHAAVLGAELLEIAAHGPLHQLDQRAGQLTAGGSGADHHRALQKATPLGIAGLLRFLQGHQQPAADFIGVLENFHRGRQRSPFLPTEVAAAGTARQEQLVVAIALLVEDDLAGLRIDVHHLTQKDLHIGRLAHHLPERRGHVGFRYQAGGHLIEQRLKKVEIAFVDQGDPHRLPAESMGRPQPGKSPADDHHMGPGRHRRLRRIELQKKALRGHDFPAGNPLTLWGWGEGPGSDGDRSRLQEARLGCRLRCMASESGGRCSTGWVKT